MGPCSIGGPPGAQRESAHLHSPPDAKVLSLLLAGRGRAGGSEQGRRGGGAWALPLPPDPGPCAEVGESLPGCFLPLIALLNVSVPHKTPLLPGGASGVPPSGLTPSNPGASGGPPAPPSASSSDPSPLTGLILPHGRGAAPDAGEGASVCPSVQHPRRPSRCGIQAAQERPALPAEVLPVARRCGSRAGAASAELLDVFPQRPLDTGPHTLLVCPGP